MLRSMGAASAAPCKRRLARVFVGFWAGAREVARREIGAAARGVSQEPHSADIDAAVEPTNRTRHFAPRWRGGPSSPETPSQGSGTIVHGNLGKASRVRRDLLVFGRCGTRSIERGARDASASRRPIQPPGRARTPDAHRSGSQSGNRASLWEAHYRVVAP